MNTVSLWCKCTQIIMRITKSAYEMIWNSFCPVPPESGGILGMRDGIVCAYLHDRSVQTTLSAEYVPDVFWMNRCIEEWHKQGVDFAGIIHSHPSCQDSLSDSDIAYIHRIMTSLPQTVSKLYFPLIIPNKKLVGVVAYRRKSGMEIKPDAIQIMCL